MYRSRSGAKAGKNGREQLNYIGFGYGMSGVALWGDAGPLYIRNFYQLFVMRS